MEKFLHGFQPNFKSNLDCMIFFWDLDLIQKPNFYHKIIFIGAATMQLTNKMAKEKKPSKKILIGEIETLDKEKRFNLNSLMRTNIDNLIGIRDLLLRG